jgi:hypothetical protein
MLILSWRILLFVFVSHFGFNFSLMHSDLFKIFFLGAAVLLGAKSVCTRSHQHLSEVSVPSLSIASCAWRCECQLLIFMVCGGKKTVQNGSSSASSWPIQVQWKSVRHSEILTAEQYWFPYRSLWNWEQAECETLDFPFQVFKENILISKGHFVRWHKIALKQPDLLLLEREVCTCVCV